MSAPTDQSDVTFEEWLEFCFGPDGQKDNDFELKILNLSGVTLAIYFQRLFTDPLKYLNHREQVHVAAGLWYIFGVGSEFWIEILKNEVPEKLQVNTVKSITTLYEKGLDVLCDLRQTQPATSTNNFNKLDSAVYMLWDMNYIESAAMSYRTLHLVDPIFMALEQALNCKTVACQISGLHGLGHLHSDNPVRVERLVDQFLKSKCDALPWVRAYAREARRGMVQ